MPKKPSTKKKAEPKSKRSHKHKTTIPKAPIRKLLKESGANVSASAVDEVVRQLEENTRIAGEKAMKLAHHAHRKTINESDILLDGVQ